MSRLASTLTWPLGLVALIVYLWVSAPPLLPEEGAGDSAALVPVEVVFRILAGENDTARGLYTRKIVGDGLKQGLAFDEDWREEDVVAGPLPALFLRATSERLVRVGSPIRLFLGSDQPIVASNLFEGEQARRFAAIRKTRQPELFFDASSGRHTAMFPDVAVAEACVTCHNEHPDSPKVDWAVGDVMGATTWTLPKAGYTREEVLGMVESFRGASAATYDEYLEEYATADADAIVPVVGQGWPEDGLAVPDTAEFMGTCAAKASAATLAHLMSPMASTRPSEN